MMKASKKMVALVAGLVAMLTLAVAAVAAVTFDPASGTGFVGKGDVQLAFGWNNKALNENAGGVSFEYSAVTVTEVSWICTNERNENIQEREQTTTTTTQGLVSHIARDNKRQITGFNLTGYSGAETSSSTTEGNPLNSCPSGPWTLTQPAGEPELVSSSGGVYAVFNGQRVLISS